jgi:hypothetical protein
MMRKRNQIKPCIYCCSIENPTKDHIPPKNLFAKPRPNNLLTVPSCKSCNEGFHLDDDYLQMIMQTYIKTSEHTESLKIKQKFIRSIHRKESVGFRQSILTNTSWIEINTEGGIYLGNALELNADWSRIERVIKRIVKGLFYLKNGIILSSDYVLEVSPISTRTKEDMAEVKQTLLPLEMQNETIIGDNVFSYRVIFHEGNIHQTAWLLIFYGNFPFLCTTFLPEI